MIQVEMLILRGCLASLNKSQRATSIPPLLKVIKSNKMYLVTFLNVLLSIVNYAFLHLKSLEFFHFHDSNHVSMA